MKKYILFLISFFTVQDYLCMKQNNYLLVSIDKPSTPAIILNSENHTLKHIYSIATINTFYQEPIIPCITFSEHTTFPYDPEYIDSKDHILIHCKDIISLFTPIILKLKRHKQNKIALQHYINTIQNYIDNNQKPGEIISSVEKLTQIYFSFIFDRFNNQITVEKKDEIYDDLLVHIHSIYNHSDSYYKMPNMFFCIIREELKKRKKLITASDQNMPNNNSINPLDQSHNNNGTQEQENIIISNDNDTEKLTEEKKNLVEKQKDDTNFIKDQKALIQQNNSIKTNNQNNRSFYVYCAIGFPIFLLSMYIFWYYYKPALLF